MTGQLTVTSVHGATRAEVVRQGVTLGAAWFGEPESCIKVEVSNAEAEVDMTDDSLVGTSRASWVFVADLAMNISHQYSQPSSGFPKCVRCRKMEPR